MTLPYKDFWQFAYCEDFDLKVQVLQAYKSKGNVSEDVKYYYNDIMGSAVHPSVIKSGLCDDNEWNNAKTLTFNNIKIDSSTVKIVFHVLPRTHIVLLKLTHNMLTVSTFENIINELLTSANNIYAFSFEWNHILLKDNSIPPVQVYLNDNDSINNVLDLHTDSISNDNDDSNSNVNNNNNNTDEHVNDIHELNILHLKAQDVLMKLFEVENKLEAISLRGNYLGNDMVKRILTALKSNTSLKVLNLYNNNITDKILDSFCGMLKLNRQLEEVNLGGNKLTDVFVKKVKDYIGVFEMKKEEVEEYENKVKERDEAIAFNHKNRNNKKVELKEIPFIDEVMHTEDKVFKVQNNVLKKMDLMLNDLTQNSFEDVVDIIDRNDQFIIVLDLLKYNKESVLMFRDPQKKYINQVFLAK
jgi:hypothetical protein